MAPLSLSLLALPAHAASSWRTIRYGGERLEVPAAWPIYDLAAKPTTCVRFDRHAVYEGTPGARSRCPAAIVGVSEALQLQPLAVLKKGMGALELRKEMINGQPALVSGNSHVTHRLVAAFPETGVLATVSFRNDEALADEILQSFLTTRATAPIRSGPTIDTATVPIRSGATSGTATAPISPGTSGGTAATQQVTSTIAPVLYKGEGFDTCQAPTESQMAAWKASSPYGAIGVYIGGVNAACVNITAQWVQDEANARWYMFPLYVGRQAPCNSQFATIQPAHATSEGTAAAEDAVLQAQSFGIGARATIYYDMEAWNTSNSTCNNAVLTFVKAWTDELHAKRYVSGFYSSLDSGINEIETIYGQTGAPDDIYFAYWDGVATTSSSGIPAGDWADHQRIKQYSGNVTQSYGGVSLNIDQDYLDAPTVGDPQPSVTGVPPARADVGSTVTVKGKGFVPRATTVRFGSVKGGNVSVISSNKLTVNVPAQDPATVDVTVTTGGGTSTTTTADQFTYIPFVGMAIDEVTGGYWLDSSAGNVDAFHVPWYGSKAGTTLPAPIVGMADLPKGAGYYLVTSKGNVYNFGQALFFGSTATKTLPAPVVGMVERPAGAGYWLVTSKGNVYNFGLDRFFGSKAGKRLPAPVVGMATLPQGGGYYLVTSKGNVYNFGHARFFGSTATKTLPAPVVGMAERPGGGGYYLVTSKGNVYNFGLARFFGSKAGKRLPAPVVVMGTTPTGYLLATSAGNVYNFNTMWYGSPAALG